MEGHGSLVGHQCRYRHLHGPCDVMSGSVGSLYDPIRVPFRTCAREGRHISHKIWIRMCPIGKARMHCVDIYIAAATWVSCRAETFCVSLYVLCWFLSLFFCLQGKSAASNLQMEATAYAETSLPTYKGTSCNPKAVCTEKNILTARILSHKILSEEIFFVDPFPLLCFERCYTLAKREGCLCGTAATIRFYPSTSILISLSL